MREILFKAKRIDNEKWVEGYYVYHINRTICPFGDSVKPEDEQHVIMQDGFSDWNMPRDTVHFDIRQETLCQYTGMKDKNGKRIWENDICEMVYDGQVHVYVIVWDEEEFDFKGTNGKKNYGRNFEYLGCCEEIVRIGNIFDNPELLGQDGEES